MLRWSPNGIFFAALQKASSSLFPLDPKSGSTRPIAVPDSSVATRFSFFKDFTHASFRGAGANCSLRANYRGSAGYGEEFRSLNVHNFDVGDYADVISSVDALIAQGLVDKDRVGAMGWSERGYISAFISASGDRFKAVSVGAGISDWMTYYVNTDISPFAPQYLHATPREDPKTYRKTSPITYIAKAKTPTLI